MPLKNIHIFASFYVTHYVQFHAASIDIEHYLQIGKDRELAGCYDIFNPQLCKYSTQFVNQETLD